MKMLNFANRNIKEMLRDPLMFIFALGFPNAGLRLRDLKEEHDGLYD